MESISARKKLTATRRWVVKIGSALLTNGGKGLALEAIADWTAQMSALRAQGIELVLVSSGAVAEGMTRLGWSERPQALHDLQAAAAEGIELENADELRELIRADRNFTMDREEPATEGAAPGGGARRFRYNPQTGQLEPQ
ncbi:hypothetical protein [uncultured Maritalea sp.]|uniref:amino acid kinase family protein n=1 Tax=uncultured Maritalea sp. TaxID=757249 RepID=UPI00260FE7EC|nr:hypothetical protein [uncultured Maritalea sp.]